MYIHKIKNSLWCVCEEGGEGPGEVIHLFQQTLCVWVGGGGGVGRWGRDWEGDSLISNCIEKSSQ